MPRSPFPRRELKPPWWIKYPEKSVGSDDWHDDIDLDERLTAIERRLNNVEARLP